MILAHLFLEQLLAPLTLFMAAVLPTPDTAHDFPVSLRAVLDENLDQAPLTLQTARRFFNATVRLCQHLTHMTHYLRRFDQHLTSFASTIETLEEEHALYMQVVSQHSVAVDRIQVLTLSRYVDTRVPMPTRSVETSTDDPRSNPLLTQWTPMAARCSNCCSPCHTDPTDPSDITARFHGLLCADCANVLTAVTITAATDTANDSESRGASALVTFRGTRLRVSVLDAGGASSPKTLNADDVGPHVSFAPDTDAPVVATPAPAPGPVLAVTTTTAATHRKSVSGPPTAVARPTTATSTRKPTAATAPAGGSNSTLAKCKFTSTAIGPNTPFPRVESRASQTTAAAADDAGKRGGERRKTAVAVVPFGGSVPGGKALAAATAAALAAQEAEDASAAQAAADARAAEDQVRRMQADLAAAETEVAHCREKLDVANHALHQLRSDQHALHALLATSQAALTSLSAQNAELSATVVAVQRERDALLAAKTDLARHLDDQRRAHATLVTAHDEGKRELANARAQTCRAKEDAGAKDVLLKQVCAEADRVQRTCRAHERHIAALEAQLEAAQASVQVLAKVSDVDTAGLSAAAGSMGADDADHVVEEVIAANNARIAALEGKNDELRQWRLREVALHRPATARVLRSHPALALAAGKGGGVHLSMHGVEPMAADRGTDPPGRAASGAARVLAASGSSVDRLYGKTARARASPPSSTTTSDIHQSDTPRTSRTRAQHSLPPAAAGAVPDDDDDDDDIIIIISPPASASPSSNARTATPASPTRRTRALHAAAPTPPPVAGPGEGRWNKRSREARRAAAAAAGEVDDDDDDEIELVAVRWRPPLAAAAATATTATPPAGQRAAYRDLYRHMEEQNRLYEAATAVLVPPPRVLPRVGGPAGMHDPGTLIAHLSAVAPAAPVAPEAPPAGRRSECAVCMDAYTHPVSTMCGHIFCRACLEVSLKRTKACPICRTTVKKNGYHPIFLP
ncbi:hypothetical protein AMAG_04589 [Allomyces macrogynus ATCC 38327]|uniref:RING-type domain-containing protein n=1 Tax=Allomyces macrogynus (strain ATCC 38327) TaxID=578462 RepID=A0A0L0S5N7_ALLM3|nr:hypothetical protein AMAG_04589 [Allomyces macrogynus ATCC 38327]|eukprot:KNE57731.1 hypothetical protein AMAG_04589 [Allomyces macrogynus ATCC 38327]